MRVNDSNLNAAASGARQASAAATEASKNREAASRAHADNDRVALSEVSHLARAAESEPPERAARVSELAAAYRSGSYQPDAAVVGRSIINDATRA